jgi:hypothetical protein
MRGLSILGDAIKKRGGKILVTHDTGQMLRSPIMAMHRFSAELSKKEKLKINKINNKYFKIAQRKYKFSTIELSDFIDDNIMAEIDKLVDVPSEDLEKIMFKEFAVGKIAQYDFILETKTPYSLDISNEQKELYLAYIKNTALTVAITNRICLHFQPSVIMTFNDYAQCQAVRYSAESNNVPRMALTYPVHFGIDASRFLIGNLAIGYSLYPHCQKWNIFKHIPIRPESIEQCWADSVFRLFGPGGSHIFSNKKNGDPASIFDKLKLSHTKKTIIVYTSSSDERLGVDILMKTWKEGAPIIDAFPNQASWLVMLRDYALSREDIQIIVRIHPREGSRQFGFDSLYLKHLKSLFTENTKNFYIIWPDDQISSYDLMELADLCLVSWSTVGQEAARLGIPVLAYAGNMTYPDDDFIQVAITQEEYKKKLDLMINFEFTWEHLVKAIRFYHWRTFIPSLDLSETVPMDSEDNSIWPKAPGSKVNIINDILSGKQDLIEYNIKQWQDSLPLDAEFQEAEAMRQGIRYFLDKIFYPPATYGENIDKLLYISGKIWRKYLRRYWYNLINKHYPPIKKSEYAFIDYTLEFITDTSRLEELCQKTKQNKKLRIIMADGLSAVLIHKGKTLRRMSPVVVRLSRLYEDSLKNN